MAGHNCPNNPRWRCPYPKVCNKACADSWDGQYGFELQGEPGDRRWVWSGPSFEVPYKEMP
jgi:hypothetical protein